ncbi:DNA-binding enhancer protein-related [Striga hermonthica]|uniref:DNA-binding enhancer protein-related n=1 Tax=Striga hermonthica TaxID=68872 RepID=A0A9N7NQ68_STRHE|nr:DNA-binding enhancer protein-related [Striga hermonthica]
MPHSGFSGFVYSFFIRTLLRVLLSISFFFFSFHIEETQYEVQFCSEIFSLTIVRNFNWDFILNIVCLFFSSLFVEDRQLDSTNIVEDRQLDSTRVQEAMATIAASKEADIQTARLRKGGLQQIKAIELSWC